MDILLKAQHKDLIKYGMIPEFMGRFPVLTILGDLSDEELVKVLTEPRNAITKQFEIAVNLLELFRLQEIPTRDVFDIDKTAKWMAMGDLFNAWHGFSWGNMRYYYNPITSKIEPVLWDSFDENHIF